MYEYIDSNTLVQYLLDETLDDVSYDAIFDELLSRGYFLWV